jgi:hypothetical protein
MDKGFKQYFNSIKKAGASEKMGMMGLYRFTLEDVITGKKTVQYAHNIIPTVGRTMIANNLTDPTPDNPMLITHAALGSNAASPAAGDTQLGTETYRNGIASRTNAANVAYATAFFNQTEVVGTFAEAGILCNGTGAANSGVILSHVNISITKTNTQKLTIDWTMTITSI